MGSFGARRLEKTKGGIVCCPNTHKEPYLGKKAASPDTCGTSRTTFRSWLGLVCFVSFFACCIGVKLYPTYVFSCSAFAKHLARSPWPISQPKRPHSATAPILRMIGKKRNAQVPTYMLNTTSINTHKPIDKSSFFHHRDASHRPTVNTRIAIEKATFADLLRIFLCESCSKWEWFFAVWSCKAQGIAPSSREALKRQLACTAGNTHCLWLSNWT